MRRPGVCANLHPLVTAIRIRLSDKSYPVVVAPGILGRAGRLMKRAGVGRRLFVVSSPPIWRRFGTILRRSAVQSGIHIETILVPDGERAKSMAPLARIHTELVRAGAERGSWLAALGGGVAGDLGGFAAATLLRGIPFVQIPTTLIAQVDSAIGGKTGINHPLGKNLVGAFYQPRLVLADPRALMTLSHRDFISGLAEAIKYGVIHDPALFDFFERNIVKILRRDMGVLTRLVARCATVKGWYVERDEYERTGLRAELNFGHTVGHALETLGGYRRHTHGEAVSMGMIAEAVLSLKLGVLKRHKDLTRLKLLLLLAGLPAEVPPYPIRKMIEVMRRDKKVRDGRIRMVLMEKIGRVRLVSLSERELKKGLSAVWS